ncbi:MAG: hypothetical protein LBS46_00525 [Dysgonamonadaceae bacterium]|jgi:predicted membrane-bound mannosyltransferase|nr:hypothetical protein [Dysgonamonadaceae bacterium]
MKRKKIKSFVLDSYTIIVFILILVALGLRIFNLDYLTLWVDEYMHTNAASAVLQAPLPDYNGIIYTWLIITLFRLLGEAEFGARFPSEKPPGENHVMLLDLEGVLYNMQIQANNK